MNIKQAIVRLTELQDLNADEMRDAMQQIMSGECTPAQVAGFLIALRMKGETAEEVAAAAEIMRKLATPVDINVDYLVDIVGTGGDNSGSFNVSTASAIVAAAAGAAVAKHGNRSVSSQSGSADLLEIAGVELQLSPQQVARCIKQTGIGFMFAPLHHSAMKHAIGPRKELAVRTVFNLLGPLTNPAFVKRQVIGVFAKQWLEPMAIALQKLGSVHAMVVHSDDGLDEFSISAASQVAELKNGSINIYTVKPSDLGFALGSRSAINVAGPEESLQMIRSVFANQAGAPLDMVLLNAGAAIYVSGLVDSHTEGVERARAVIANGAAQNKFEELINVSNSLNG